MATTASDARDFALYHGVSNRSRGWKSRRPDEPAETHAPRQTGIKRWDGHARTSAPWDGLRRDPELWFRHGNCFVHLYARGQSRRGPAFKLPFSTLLASQCHALIERFIARDMPVVSAVRDGPPSLDGSDSPDSSLPPPMPMPSPPPPLATLDYWSRAHLLGRVDLYVPPPPHADKDQTVLYYLAIRNLVAWIFRRPAVGEHLGSALAGLFSAMCEFRPPNADNVRDLQCYLEDEGYLAMAGRPEYALAILQLAETMRFRDLYLDAFTHCVGMYNDLYHRTEYQHVGAASRKLIRRARLDMDLRLGSAGMMLSNFLDDDLSETYLGLPAPARAHLDRFRAYVQGFYTTRLGYYPPASMDARSTIFEPHVYRILADDFQALYDYLVDESYTDGATGPARAQGGLCTLQCVQSFDARHRYPSQLHPLPLLPDDASPPALSLGPSSGFATIGGRLGAGLGAGPSRNGAASRRMSWFGGKAMDRLLAPRAEKLKPDARLVAHSALLKAANTGRADVWRNEFVGAYRQFEEDAVFAPHKADRMEKISLADGRKVRWILIYAVHQTLQNCFTPPPPEASDADAVAYHMSVSTKHVPAWKDDSAASTPGSAASAVARFGFGSGFDPCMPVSAAEPIARARSVLDTGHGGLTVGGPGSAAAPSRSMSMTVARPATAGECEMDRGRALSPVFDIRPDIDYLGLANRSDAAAQDGEVEVVVLPRSRSLTRSLSQKSAFRRSLSLFRGNSSQGVPLVPPPPPPMPQAPASVRSPKGKQTAAEEAPERLDAPARQQNSSSPAPYHEIVVHGYGNGTNPVQHLSAPASASGSTTTITAAAVSADPTPAATTTDADEEPDDGSHTTDDSVTTPSTARSLSTSSTSSNASAATAETAKTSETSETAATVLTESTSNRSSRVSVACAATAPVPSVPSRSSSVCSNVSERANAGAARRLSIAAAPMCGGSTAEAPPAIPPRGRTAAVPTCSPAVSRSSSLYSTASAEKDILAPALALARAHGTTPVVPPVLSVPPVPARSSARHRRFSVYGGGDEYAGVVPLTAVPPGMNGLPRQQEQPQRAAPQRFDMVQEALQAVRETMEQQAMGEMCVPGASSFGVCGGLSAPPVVMARASSFVGVASLRSVREDDELLGMAAAAAAAAAAAGPTAARSRSQSHASRYHRHSSYLQHGPGYAHHYNNVRHNHNDGDDDDDHHSGLAASRHHHAGDGDGGRSRRRQDSDVQPEWEKFAVGLGGHTVV